MSWLRRAPSPEKAEVELALKEAESERQKRRSALKALMSKLAVVQLDTALVDIGRDLARTPEAGDD